MDETPLSLHELIHATFTPDLDPYCRCRGCAQRKGFGIPAYEPSEAVSPIRLPGL